MSEESKVPIEATSNFGKRPRSGKEIVEPYIHSDNRSNSTTSEEYSDSSPSLPSIVHNEDLNGIATSGNGGELFLDLTTDNAQSATQRRNIDFTNSIRPPGISNYRQAASILFNDTTNTICSDDSSKTKTRPFDEHYVAAPAIRDPRSVSFKSSKNTSVESVHGSSQIKPTYSDDDSNETATAIPGSGRFLLGAIPKSRCQSADTSTHKDPDVRNTASKAGSRFLDNPMFSRSRESPQIFNQGESRLFSKSKGSVFKNDSPSSEVCGPDISAKYSAPDTRPSTSVSQKSSQSKTGSSPVQFSEPAPGPSPKSCLKAPNDKSHPIRGTVRFNLNLHVISYIPERSSKRKQFFKEFKESVMRKFSLRHTKNTMIDSRHKYVCSRKELPNSNKEEIEVDIDDSDESSDLINRFSEMSTSPAKPYAKTFRLLSTIGKPFIKLKQTLSKNHE